MRLRFPAVSGAVLLLAGCTVGPDFHAPSWVSPSSWTGQHPPVTRASLSVPAAEPVDPHWWTAFNDPELTSLEERVAAANLDVRVATIRLAESRASRGIAASDAFPSMRGNASYTREKLSEKGAIDLLGGAGSNPATQASGAGGTTGGVPASATGASGNSAIFAPFDLFQYGFDASWELDLWGRVRRSVESADANVGMSEEAQRDALLSSLAEVARDYIQLRGVQVKTQIAQDNLKTAQQSLTLTQQRAAGGLTTDLDVANADTQVRNTAAEIPNLQQQEAQLINALSFLLGQQPNALRGELEQSRPIPPVPPTIPVGLPSELARRRPDIRQAEAQLHASTADVGVAVANFYPSVTLSGSVSLQALQFKNLGNWDARQYGIGPSITLPIFEGGKLRATLELRKAQQQEAAIAYQRTVLNAWHEVDNALTAYDTEQRRRAQLQLSVVQAQRAFGLAQDRYRQGLSDFLQVLDAQRSLLGTQEQLAESTTQVSGNLVAIYKALGGGWESEFPVQQTADASPPQ